VGANLSAQGSRVRSSLHLTEEVPEKFLSSHSGHTPIKIVEGFRMKVFLVFVSMLIGSAPFLALSEQSNFQEKDSFFGRTPNRFQALEDEEGREVDFHSKDFSSGRSPASAKPRLDEAAEPTRIQRQLSQEQGDADREESENSRSPASTEERVFKAPSRPTRVSDSAEIQGRGISSLSSPMDGGSTRTEWMQENTRLKEPFAESDSVARRKGVQEVSVIANDLGFFPKTFFVSRNVPVRLYVTGATKNSTCLMMDAFNVRKQLRMNKVEEITFVPNQAGTYRFYCPVNNSDGTMVVKEINP
jgi:hypothetical protein